MLKFFIKKLFFAGSYVFVIIFGLLAAVLLAMGREKRKKQRRIWIFSFLQNGSLDAGGERQSGAKKEEA